MKINLDAVILNLDNVPMTRESAPDSPPATLGWVIRSAVIAQNQDSDPASQLKCFDLAIITTKGGEQDITPEQATLAKERIARVFGNPVITGRCTELLNG